MAKARVTALRAGIWYLGIDLGTTGLSATLFDRGTCQLYPIYWSESGQGKLTFHLSSPVKLLSQQSGLQELKPLLRTGIVGTRIDPQQRRGLHPEILPQEVLRRRQGQKELVLRSQGRSVGLETVLEVLQSLLATLKSGNLTAIEQGVLSAAAIAGGTEARSLATRAVEIADSPNFICSAAGLERESFARAIASLRGAIVSCPGNWPDSYRFNLREAILGAKLVEDVSQIIFVENAIAAWLSVLPGSGGERVTIPSTLQSQFHPQEGIQWSRSLSRSRNFRYGFAIDAGATTTELALIWVPDRIEDLTHSHFKTRSLAYAGLSVDQDIICQLFWNERIRRENLGYWELGCDLELPHPGQADPLRRHRLQQRLWDSPQGRELLMVAERVKLHLQDRDLCVTELGGERWAIARRDVERLVFAPFVETLNRELNELSIETGISTMAIDRAVCTGGTGRSPILGNWLRQKLPNAVLVVDPPSEAIPNASRVAYGLATLPLYPGVADLHRQQYGDYFLLAELVRSLPPDRGVSFAEILALVERRGIHARSLQSRIQGLLDGDLPPGLRPTADLNVAIEAIAQSNPYPLDPETPLFDKSGSTYQVNTDTARRLLHYLEAIAATSHQHFEEPLLISWKALVAQS